MEFIIIGIVTAINMIVIISKVKHNRYEDAFFDFTLLLAVVILFSGSYGGMVVAMIASMIISIYLYAYPPQFFRSFVKSRKTKKAKIKLVSGVKRFVKDLNDNGSEKLIDVDFKDQIKKLKDIDV